MSSLVLSMFHFKIVRATINYSWKISNYGGFDMWVQRFVKTARGTFEVFEKGEGEPLAVTHLYSEYDERGNAFANPFADHYHVYLINLRGAGKSQAAQSEEQYSMKGSCDQSFDSVKFTEIAEFMIMQSAMDQTENPDTVIQGYILRVEDDKLLIGVDINIMQYEWLKDEIQHTGLDAYAFDFVSLEGVKTDEFKIGDKIEAIIKGSITGVNPGSARVKDIKKLYISN